jgi:ankyrin repeat protein
MSASKTACKTEIFIAIEYGDVVQVKRMINAYPQLVHIKTQNSWTPITFAVRYGQLEIVKVLVEAGADIKHKNPLLFTQYS